MGEDRIGSDGPAARTSGNIRKRAEAEQRPPEQETVTLRRCEHCGSHHTLAVGAFRVRCESCKEVSEPKSVEFVPLSALARLQAVEAERDAAHHALRQCIRLTGVDLSDGFPTQPPLHEFAVSAVHELRVAYDDDGGPDE